MIKRSFCAALMALGLIGCGDSGPKLVPVTGTVTLDNQPMAAEVMFTPDPSNVAITAGGDTSGAAGNYKAMHAQRSGLAPGKYTVTVTQKTAEQAAATSSRLSDDPGMLATLEATRRGATTKAPKAVEKKAPPSQTFEIEIGPSGGTFDFDVKSDPNA